MQLGQHAIYDEVICILKAEYECAESLQATSTEIQSLMDAEKFQQVQERLISRGEVIEMMASLDQQLVTLLSDSGLVKNGAEWDQILELVDALRGLLTSIRGVDQLNQRRMKQHCDEIGEKLRLLQQGKTLVKGYQRPMMRNQHSFSRR